MSRLRSTSVSITIDKCLDYDREESRLRSTSVSTTIEKVLDHDREDSPKKKKKKKKKIPLALDLRYRDASRLRWFFNLVLMHLFILLHQANLLPLLYATILYLLQVRKWQGRIPQHGPLRGRNSRLLAGLRPLMLLQVPPPNPWTPRDRVSTLRLHHRRVTCRYYIAPEFYYQS